MEFTWKEIKGAYGNGQVSCLKIQSSSPNRDIVNSLEQKGKKSY